MENELRLSGTSFTVTIKSSNPNLQALLPVVITECAVSKCSWNVEGLSQCLKYSDFLNLVCTFDFFVSESWQRSLNNYEIEDFESVCIQRPDSLNNTSKHGLVEFVFSIVSYLAGGISVVEKDNYGII